MSENEFFECDSRNVFHKNAAGLVVHKVDRRSTYSSPSAANHGSDFLRKWTVVKRTRSILVTVALFLWTCRGLDFGKTLKHVLSRDKEGFANFLCTVSIVNELWREGRRIRPPHPGQ